MTRIVNLTHETGDLSQYTTTVTDSGDLSVSHAAALVGAYGLSCVIDDATSIYGTKSGLTITSGVVRGRFFIHPNSLAMANNAYLTVCRLMKSSTLLCIVRLDYSTSAGYKITPLVINDVGGLSYNSAAISNALHMVEFCVTRASSAVASDGSLLWWIDGTAQTSLAGIDNYDSFSDLNSVILGALSITGSVSGTLYLDDFEVNDDGGVIGSGKTIDDCLEQVRTTARTVTGLRAVPDGVPDSANVFPFYAAWHGPSVVYRESADTLRGLWSIISQVHFSRADLLRAEQYADSFASSIAGAFLDDPTLAGTCETIGRVNISRFGPLTWGDVPTVGFEIVLEDIKIREMSQI